MAEVVASTGVSKEAGYFYYLGKDGNVWRTKMASGGKPGGGADKVADANVSRESGYLYYIDGWKWKCFPFTNGLEKIIIF